MTARMARARARCAGAAVDAEAAGAQIDGEAGFDALALRLLARDAHVGEHLAHGVAVLAGFVQALEGDGDQADHQGHQGDDDEQLDEGEAGGAARGRPSPRNTLFFIAARALPTSARAIFDQYFNAPAVTYCLLRTSTFSPSPPGALSAPSDRISRPPLGPGLA
jgi:hypothetical protein